MTIEELPAEALAILKSLVNNPHAVEDCPALRMLFEAAMAMGSPNKVHITAA